MKLFILTVVILLFSLSQAFAHEEAEVTNLAEADWLNPLIAVLIIVVTIIIARIVRLKLKNKLLIIK